MFFVSLSVFLPLFFFKYITLFVKKIPRAVIAPSIVNNAAKTFHTLPHPPNTVTCDTLILYHKDRKGEIGNGAYTKNYASDERNNSNVHV